jgi:hypothetical protein
MIVGGYVLHLYCEQKNPDHGHQEFPHEFGGETGGEARKEARQRGWKLDLENSIGICPKCAKKGIKDAPRK